MICTKAKAATTTDGVSQKLDFYSSKKMPAIFLGEHIKIYWFTTFWYVITVIIITSIPDWPLWNNKNNWKS